MQIPIQTNLKVTTDKQIIYQRGAYDEFDGGKNVAASDKANKDRLLCEEKNNVKSVHK